MRAFIQVVSALQPMSDDYDGSGVSEPCLPPGTAILAQVPPWTNFQELPWKSTVEVPWQVVPGPAAQSFCPFRATPKHFSLCAATAASPSAFVSGAAKAVEAMAAVTALARIAAGILVGTDICLSPVVDLSVHREAHSCYFGFQTPSVTASGTKGASISRLRAADGQKNCL